MRPTTPQGPSRRDARTKARPTLRPQIEGLEWRHLLASDLVGPLAVSTVGDSGIIQVVALPISAAAGVPAVGVSTASFRIQADKSTAGLTVSIEWGDGTTSPGTLALRPGPITQRFGSAPIAIYYVVGTHTYAAAGVYPTQTTVSGSAGVVATIPGQAVVTAEAISASGLPIAAVAGADIAGQPASNASDVRIASFTDTVPALAPGAFSATINWGDGSAPTLGRISADFAKGGFAVSGDHTYATPGSFSVQVTITSLGGASATSTATATIAPSTSETLGVPGGDTSSGAAGTGPTSPVHGFGTAGWGKMLVSAATRTIAPKTHKPHTPPAAKGHHHRG